MRKLMFDVFGTSVLIIRTESGWQAFYPGPEGKRRPARDITVPAQLKEAQIAQYLDDLCHEWASERNNNLRRID